jgi:hypothetical protein
MKANRLWAAAIVILLLIRFLILPSLPEWFLATVAIGAFAFWMMRKHRPSWTPWRDSKGESVFGRKPRSTPSAGGSNHQGLDLRPIKTDRWGNRL